VTKKHDRHHDHCEHDLSHCGKCDLAYCTKCSREWGAKCTLAHSPWYVYPTITTSGTATDYPGANTTYTCAHTN
jgi:hypothetical protein